MERRAAVVFAGGQGTRLWPLSRDSRPKQFQAMTGSAPLLTMTIDRLKEVVPAERIYISTIARFREAALECRSGIPEENLILEAVGKGPSTAFALAHAHVAQRHGDVSVITCPSDHMIDDEAALTTAYSDMFAIAEESHHPVVLAARPLSPDPGFGYYQTDPVAEGEPLRAHSMLEKPSSEVAAAMIAEGNVWWNTANYVIRTSTVLEGYRARRAYAMTSIDRHLRDPDPEGYAGVAAEGHELTPMFEAGLRPHVLVREFGWRDVGTWPRLEEILTTQSTSAIGAATSIDSQDVLTASLDGRQIITLGVEGLLVVTHKDAVYVIDKERAWDKVELDRWRSLLAGGREGVL